MERGRLHLEKGDLMNKLSTLSFVLVASLSAACVGTETGDEPAESQESPITGNGAPSGSHYSLNIIGVPQDKTADMTGNNGHRIFMKLGGKGKIMLKEGADFQVLDANGTDGEASFEMPNPDPDNDGTTDYSVFARALGTPGGAATMQTCATDSATGELLCSVATVRLDRSKGKSTFTNVSAELLYIYIDLDGDGDAEHYNIFNDALEGYFWEYDNHGLKLCQARFYEISTTVPPTWP